MERIRFLDTTCTVQVIGNIYNNPSLLNKTYLTEDDFPNKFHKIVYGTLYNLYHNNKIIEFSENIILDYLENKPKAEAVFKSGGGIDFLRNCAVNAEEVGYNYYVERLQKMTLLRQFSKIGVDVSNILDEDNIIDTKKKEKQEEWLNNASLSDISDRIQKQIDKVVNNFGGGAEDLSCQAAEGVRELIESLKTSPAYGLPFYDPVFTSVSMGARLGKFYLRSAGTGLGKTRALVQDAAFLSSSKYYDSNKGGWVTNPAPVATLLILTEQDRSEVQTLLLSFIAEVDEAHMLTGEYLEGEEDRILEAIKVLEESSLYLEFMPDFSLEDIERRIKYNIEERGVYYICFDYIQSTMKILSEISSRSKVGNLREDQILFLLSTKIKDIAVQYNIWIMSSTQLSGDIDTSTPDQRLLRGAKSIGDKLDLGCHLLNLNERDLDMLTTLEGYFKIDEYGNKITPNVKLAVYKNRRAPWNNIYLFGYKRLEICRIDFIIATDWNYELVKGLKGTNINVEKGAF